MRCLTKDIRESSRRSRRPWRPGWARSRLSRCKRDWETFLKAIALASDLRKETPRDEYLLADVGGYYAAIGMKEESLPLLAQAAALAPAVPQVLYQVAIGYEDLHHRDEALRWLARAKASGYPSESIVRNPQLAALRADPRYGATVGGAR